MIFFFFPAPAFHCQTKASNNQKCDDYCNICWSESLIQSPILQLKCSHFFHKTCIEKSIKTGWNGARITFGFLECPLCKKLIEHKELDGVLKEQLQLKGIGA